MVKYKVKTKAFGEIAFYFSCREHFDIAVNSQLTVISLYSLSIAVVNCKDNSILKCKWTYEAFFDALAKSNGLEVIE